MDRLHLVTLGVTLWGSSVMAVLALFWAARGLDQANDRDLAEANRVRDLGLPSLPPLTSRSKRREPAQAHPGLERV